MANKVYPKAKEKMLSGSVNMPTDTIKAALIDLGTYTYSDAHEFFSSITGVVGTPVALANKSVTGGVFLADSAVFSAVTGATVEAVLIYKDTGAAATSPVLALVDQGTGLPITPNGGSITINWGGSNIFGI